MEMEISYTKLNKGNYQSAIDLKRICEQEPIAISSHRLLAHVQNPTLSQEDTFLIVASLGNKTIGYIGVFADRIKIKGEVQKIGWLSTWYIDPNSGVKGVGRELLNAMYNEYGGKIGISQFTESAKRVYDKSGYFQDLSSLKGFKHEIRFNTAYYFGVKWGKQRFLKSLLGLGDKMANLAWNAWLGAFKPQLRSGLSSVQVDYLSRIDRESEAFIEAHSNNDFCVRDRAFFEYLYAHRWVLESPMIEELSLNEKYFFSSYSSRFGYYFIKLSSSSNKPCAFVVLQLKDHVLKVLQIYQEQAMDEIARVVMLHAISTKAATILCYNEELNRSLKQNSQLILRSKKKTRQSIISSQFGNIPEESRFQYGDGDCSFA